MTVLELSASLKQLNYNVPIEMFTHAWTRRQVRKIRDYFLWRMANHRGPGRPFAEPKCLIPFKVRRIVIPIRHSDIPEGTKVCWSLKLSGDIHEPVSEAVENGVTLRVLSEDERQDDLTRRWAK